MPLTSVRLFLVLLLCLSAIPAYPQPIRTGFVEATEEDLDPSCFGYQLKFANGNVTDNGDGSCSVADNVGSSGDVTDVGDCDGPACFTGTEGTVLTFKGSSSGTTALQPSAAASGTLTLPAETGTVCSTGSICTGYQESITVTSPLTLTGGDLRILNAIADGSTKGATAFTVNDFNNPSIGLISIDYANGQKATTSVPGFLTSADWNTFNSKQQAITVTSPLTLTGGDLRILNAIADGSSKGATSFTVNDFNNPSIGLISIDYANGQKATTTLPGFLSATDWTTFNNKISKDGTTVTTAQIPFAIGLKAGGATDFATFGSDGSLTLDGAANYYVDLGEPAFCAEVVTLACLYFSITPSGFLFTDTTGVTVGYQGTDGYYYSAQGFDVLGAVDMDIGSADVTDVQIITDGTGTAEVVLPNDSIGATEVDFVGTATGTSGNILVADGTDFESVVLTGDAIIFSGGSIVISNNVSVTGWELGASTATTASANDNDGSLATTAFVQGEIMTNYYLSLSPQGAVLDDNSPPAITVQESTGTGTSRRYIMDFDSATDEIIYWSFVLPVDYSGGNLVLQIDWFSNDIGANETCFWESQISCTTEADTDSLLEDASGTSVTASEDVNTTEANRKISTTLTLNQLDSAAAGDYCTLRFNRDANNASDDLTSDARLLAVRLAIPRI